MPETMLLLGVDTCGPSGSIALARLSGSKLESLGETELAGRSYSATLVAGVRDLLNQTGTRLTQLRAIVAVNGPGSFTGVRVGLSVVKGLAEPSRIPVLAVSRLEVLACKAGMPSAALDAHRREVFLRVAAEGEKPRELLAGSAELATIRSWPDRVAVCDDSAAFSLGEAWPRVPLTRVAAPTANDALKVAVPCILATDFVDLAQLDGYYLRRSDAEIFGEAAP
jgi:tRNA threonylcarbamoyladenosine biosynthesis protein TsaB